MSNEKYTPAQAIELAIADHKAGRLIDWPFVEGLRVALDQVNAHDDLRAALEWADIYMVRMGAVYPHSNDADMRDKASAAIAKAKGA